MVRLTNGTSGLRARCRATLGYTTEGRHKRGRHATGLSTVCDPFGTAAPPLTALLVGNANLWTEGTKWTELRDDLVRK